jgi:hypothetical protein
MLKRRENEELAVAERYVGLSRNLNLDRMRRSCGNWEERGRTNVGTGASAMSEPGSGRLENYPQKEIVSESLLQ